MIAKAIMTERDFNLVAPLACPATAMRNTDTTEQRGSEWSGAVSPLIGQQGDLWGDVDSATGARPTLTVPGTRTSTTATRTTTTRTTSFAPEPSADRKIPSGHADFLFSELVQAYVDCRKHKRNSDSAIDFEIGLERNLARLYEDLASQSYAPGKTICFVVTKPRPREVWAAEFRDRIVHHLLYNRISDYFLRRFIFDSCACIKGRGTLFGAERLESKIRGITQNWTKPAYYLKCDLANFFVSIDKSVLWPLIAAGTPPGWWTWLAHKVVWHDPTADFIYRGDPALLDLVPPHKRLTNQASGFGLAIGNHSSQFEANVLLNVLDQFIKHQIGARHYVRYVDDFVLLHESAQWLNEALAKIDAFLPERLNLRLNHKKTILQPISRGVDFVGQVIRPHHRRTRRRTVGAALSKCRTVGASDLPQVANSYLGLIGKTKSHHIRAKICNIARKRGHSVSMDLTKTYRWSNHGIQK